MAQRVAFLIAGVQKAGTSALHRYLSDHPELYLPRQKELHFFDNDSLTWPPDNDDSYTLYHTQFETAPPQRIWGEATPIYTYWWPSMARIWEYNPGMKFIILLRNPITRAFSHWNMERQRGNETLGFLEALRTEQQRCRLAVPQQHRIFSYCDRGFYSEQLRRLWHFFPRRQTLVIKQDALLHEPANTLALVHSHLNVSPMSIDAPQRTHCLAYDQDMEPEAYRWLKSVFEPEIRILETMLQWDCSDWLHA
jgi:hypothetical protein